MKEFEFTEPINGVRLKLEFVPIESLEISKYQRKISRTLLQSLTASMLKLGFVSFPLVVKKDGTYYVADGQHRVEAAKAILGNDKEIPVIVLPDDKIYEFSLYYNVEKTPNIREKSQQAVSLYIDSVTSSPDMKESELWSVINVPYYVTFGFALLENERFSPATFEFIAKKVDFDFMEVPISEAKEKRLKWASLYNDCYSLLNKVIEKREETDPFAKQKILHEVFVSLYGERVRSIEDDIETCLNKIKTSLEEML